MIKLVLVAAIISCVGGYSYKSPPVMVVLFARNKEHTLPYFLTAFENIDYPKSRMSLYIRADHCEDQTIPILEYWLHENRDKYHSVDSVLNKSLSRYRNENATEKGELAYQNIISLKQSALEKARESWADYVLFLDVDVFIVEPDIINILMGENVAIITPMMNSLGRYSNFWGGMDKDYWYIRTDEYIEILDRKKKGCFAMPMVHSFVLINLKVAETDKLTFDPYKVNNKDIPLDDIISFAISSKEADLEMTLCNEQVYGFMAPSVIDNERPEIDALRLKSLKLEVLVAHPPLSVSPSLVKFLPKPIKKNSLGFDKIYLINLDRRQERKTRMELCFEELGITVESIEAVDGKLLDESKIKEMKISYMPDYKDPWLGRHMTYGEVGCFLSHYEIWIDVVQNGYEKVLLFEDDIRFEPFFREHLGALVAHLGELSLDWDLIYLGRKILKQDEPMVEGSDRLVHVNYSYWTLCYMLSGRGARKLLAADPLKNLLPVDEFLPIMFDKHPEAGWASHFSDRSLKAFSISPILVVPTHYTGEQGYISDTEESALLPAPKLENATLSGPIGPLANSLKAQLFDPTTMGKNEL